MASEALINYFSQVLGIKSWLSPEVLEGFSNSGEGINPYGLQEFDGSLRPERLEQSFDIVFLHLHSGGSSLGNRSLFVDDSWTLFEKMKLAMKSGLSPRSLESLEVEASEEVSEIAIPWIQKHLKSKVLIVLSSSPKKHSSAAGKAMIVETWCPWSLLQNPERKREAWDSLQLAMRSL